MGSFSANPGAIAGATSELTAAASGLSGIGSEISAGISTISSARGSEYLTINSGTLTEQPNQAREIINNLVSLLEGKLAQIQSYQSSSGAVPSFGYSGTQSNSNKEPSIVTKGVATAARIGATWELANLKIAEGGISFLETIVDGGATILSKPIGWFSPKTKEKIGAFVEKDHVGDFFTEQYENGFLKNMNNLSYLKHDSTGAKILKGGGTLTTGMALTFATGGAVGGGLAGVATEMGLTFLSGTGRGTEAELKTGKSYDSASKSGIKQGIIEGGIVGLAGPLSKIGGKAINTGSKILKKASSKVSQTGLGKAVKTGGTILKKAGNKVSQTGNTILKKASNKVSQTGLGKAIKTGGTKLKNVKNKLVTTFKGIGNKVSTKVTNKTGAKAFENKGSKSGTTKILDQKGKTIKRTTHQEIPVKTKTSTNINNKATKTFKNGSGKSGTAEVLDQKGKVIKRTTYQETPVKTKASTNINNKATKTFKNGSSKSGTAEVLDQKGKVIKRTTYQETPVKTKTSTNINNKATKTFKNEGAKKTATEDIKVNKTTGSKMVNNKAKSAGDSVKDPFAPETYYTRAADFVKTRYKVKGNPNYTYSVDTKGRITVYDSNDIPTILTDENLEKYRDVVNSLRDYGSNGDGRIYTGDHPYPFNDALEETIKANEEGRRYAKVAREAYANRKTSDIIKAKIKANTDDVLSNIKSKASNAKSKVFEVLKQGKSNSKVTSGVTKSGGKKATTSTGNIFGGTIKEKASNAKSTVSDTIEGIKGKASSAKSTFNNMADKVKSSTKVTNGVTEVGGKKVTTSTGNEFADTIKIKASNAKSTVSDTIEGIKGKASSAKSTFNNMADKVKSSTKVTNGVTEVGGKKVTTSTGNKFVDTIKIKVNNAKSNIANNMTNFTNPVKITSVGAANILSQKKASDILKGNNQTIQEMPNDDTVPTKQTPKEKDAPNPIESPPNNNDNTTNSGSSNINTTEYSTTNNISNNSTVGGNTNAGSNSTPNSQSSTGNNNPTKPNVGKGKITTPSKEQISNPSPNKQPANNHNTSPTTKNPNTSTVPNKNQNITVPNKPQPPIQNVENPIPNINNEQPTVTPIPDDKTITTPNTSYNNGYTKNNYTQSISQAIKTPVDNISDNVQNVVGNITGDSSATGNTIDTIKKGNVYTKIPTSSTPVSSSSTSGSSAIPIIAGLGVATAAGIGAKVYLDRKNDNDEEYDEQSDNIMTDNWNNEETYDIDYNAGIEKPEYLEDDNYMNKDDEKPVEKYDARSSDELIDLL